jgi:hypothetical protein
MPILAVNVDDDAPEEDDEMTRLPHYCAMWQFSPVPWARGTGPAGLVIYSPTPLLALLFGE